MKKSMEIHGYIDLFRIEVGFKQNVEKKMKILKENFLSKTLGRFLFKWKLNGIQVIDKIVKENGLRRRRIR